VRVLRGPQLSATCVALAPDESASYCGAKGGSLWRWDLATGVRTQLKTPTSNGGSNRDVLAVACSPDGRLLASAGRSAAVVIWDCRTLAKVMELPGHRDAVTSLAVSRSSSAADPNPELFSASADRCVKVWNFQLTLAVTLTLTLTVTLPLPLPRPLPLPLPLP
jgi:ribosomal RNA-processing protein 9